MRETLTKLKKDNMKIIIALILSQAIQHQNNLSQYSLCNYSIDCLDHMRHVAYSSQETGHSTHN